MNWNAEAKALAKDFVKIAKITRIGKTDITFNDIIVDVLPIPHRPEKLPEGKMAVYIFAYKGKVLKVGKVGPGSIPRFQSQHYTGTAAGTLAKFLNEDKRDKEFSGRPLDEIGDIMKKRFNRINYLLDEKWGDFTLSLFEAFLHCRLEPKYERKHKK